MALRFDHAAVAVRDLDAAIRRYDDLGFAVSPGGQHPGQGTRNAIIRFGLDYVELLAVADEAAARAGSLSGPMLADFVRAREGIAGYALATTTIEQAATRFDRGSGAAVTAEGPFPMQRRRPDGNLLAWRLLVPHGVPWRRPWPFLIQWDTPDEQRLSWERPGTHPNTVTGVAGLTLVVADLARTLDLYERRLEVPLSGQDAVPDLAARRATFLVGTVRIDLLAPAGDGPVQRALADQGEGPYELALGASDLEQARRVLSQAGVACQPVAGNPAALSISPDQACGARLVLVARGGIT
jgi:catechol 2,3-dioxygenase-like lactoylglutathione lyase family enzyme